MKTAEIVTATRIEPTSESLIIYLGNERFSIPWERCSDRLKSASTQDRMHSELSPGGYGIHWPTLDEDLSIIALLRDSGVGVIEESTPKV